MRHRVAHRKLGRTTPHRIALLRNLATALFERERIRTTLMKAKELRPYAEKLITLAKRDEDRLHARRQVAQRHQGSAGRAQAVRQRWARASRTRPGGYTRILAWDRARATARRWRSSSCWAPSTSPSARRTRRPRSPSPRRPRRRTRKRPRPRRPQAQGEEGGRGRVAARTPEPTSRAGPRGPALLFSGLPVVLDRRGRGLGGVVERRREMQPVGAGAAEHPGGDGLARCFLERLVAGGVDARGRTRRLDREADLHLPGDRSQPGERRHHRPPSRREVGDARSHPHAGYRRTAAALWRRERRGCRRDHLDVGGCRPGAESARVGGARRDRLRFDRRRRSGRRRGGRGERLRLRRVAPWPRPRRRPWDATAPDRPAAAPCPSRRSAR